MAYIHCVTGGSGGGIPPQLQSDMDSVLNKKLGTSTTYPSTDWAKEVNLMGLLPEKTVSGAVASFPDGADDVPIKTATFDIAPNLDGVSAVKVTRCGVNLWDEEWEKGTINNQGQNSTDNTRIRSKNYIPVKPNTSIYFFHSGGIASLFYYKKDKTFISSGSFDNSKAYTIPSECYFVRFIMASAYGTTYNNDISINYPSTDTSYHAYSATTRTISLGQTVYGGSVTVDEDGECTYDDGEGNTSDLDPITPITSALGVNNIWCDTGDSSVTYRANNKSVLQFDYAFENSWTLYNNGLSGTDVIKPVLSFTADGDVSFKYKGVRIYTNTGSDDGFFALRKNGTVVYKQNLTTGATAQYTNIPSVDLETGDTVEFCIGFDGTHSGCTFAMYKLT